MGGQTVERNDPPLPWVNANFPFAGPVAHREHRRVDFSLRRSRRFQLVLRGIDPPKPFKSFRSDSYRRAMGSVRHAFITKRPLRPFNVRGKVGVFDGQRSVVPEQPSETIDTAVEHPLLPVGHSLLVRLTITNALGSGACSYGPAKDTLPAQIMP